MLLKKWLIILGLCSLIIVGCSISVINNSTNQPKPSITTTSDLPINTFTRSPTVTKTPTNNITKTVSPSKTASVLRTTSWTPMSLAEQNQYWIDLISTNNECKLPCWLGLIPGKATEDDISSLLYPISGRHSALPTTDYVRKDSIFTVETSDGFPELYFDLFDQNGILLRVYVVTDSLNRPPSDPIYAPQLTEAMQIYSLDQVLTIYGKPSRVLIGVKSGPAEAGAPWLYHLFVIYDNLSFMIYYEGGDLHRLGDTISVCPSYLKLSYLTMFLQSPESESTLDVFVQDIYGVSLEDMASQGMFMDLKSAANISLEDFYLKFKQSNPETCIETNANLWR